MVQFRNLECIPAPFLRRMRACIARFADAHVDYFGTPASVPTWVALVDSGRDLEGPERQSLERAFGIVLNVFRSGAELQPSTAALEQLLDERPGGMAMQFEPDPSVLAILQDPDDEATRSFARAMTIFRVMIDKGLVRGDSVDAFLMEVLDRVPARTDMMRSAVDAARSLVLVLIELLLGRAVD